MKKQSLPGKNLQVWVDGECINLSTNCQIQIQAVTTEGETKDDPDNSTDIDSFTWSVQNDSQLEVDMKQNVKILKTMLAKTVVPVKIGIPANASTEEIPEEGWTAPTAGYFSGRARITQYTGGGQKGSKATQSITLTGIGDLTVVEATD